MFSPTEDRVRDLIDKLTRALTQETDVKLVPSDSWAADPESKPPTLYYRLSDVAVIGDKILSVTAHEIAHLLYTTPYTYPFEVPTKPRAAHLLCNVVEDARIERKFAESFPGAESLFEQMHGEGEADCTWTKNTIKGFPTLPIKWRYLLNIDRVLHGLPPLGDQRDKDAISDTLTCLENAANEGTTQELANHLEPAYLKLLDLMRQEKNEKEAERKAAQKAAQAASGGQQQGQQAQTPPGVEHNPTEDDDDQGNQTGQQSDHAFPEGADTDDHKDGGTDGTPGNRERAEGIGNEGADDGQEAQDESPGSGPGGEESGEGAGGDGDLGGGADVGDGDDTGSDGASLSSVKPMNILDEMVQEEQGSKNKTIETLRWRQRQRAKQAREVDKQISAEYNELLKEIGNDLGFEKITAKMRSKLTNSRLRYISSKRVLDREIRTLRSYARSVLEDNARERFGGSYTKGKKVKKSKLYRVMNNDPRLFERKELVGGKSYAIAIAVDQSTSMGGHRHRYRGDEATYSRSNYYRMSDQQLAYEAAVTFLEAFDGLIDTAMIGFSDFYNGPRGRHGYPTSPNAYSPYRVYKRVEDELERRTALIAEADMSHGGTPMAAGIKAAIETLKGSSAEVKALIVITDGCPGDPDQSQQELVKAHRNGVQTYCLHIGSLAPGAYGVEHKQNFLANFRHTVEVTDSKSIPTSVSRLLKGIVRRRTAA